MKLCELINELMSKSIDTNSDELNVKISTKTGVYDIDLTFLIGDKYLIIAAND